MPRAPRRRLDAETRRAEIVDAAASVFEGRDAHDVTFEAVAEAAGVSRALVYNYFRDKGELLAAVHLRSLRRLDDALADAGGLREVVRTYLRFARDDPVAFRTLIDTESAHHPAVRAARQERLEAIARSWGGSSEAHVLASAVLGLLEAATVTWLEEDPAADVDRVADLLVAVLRDGLHGAALAGVPIHGGRQPASRWSE